jgi:hypothetical protein
VDPVSEETAWRPNRSPDGHLRVSDRERDETIDVLVEAATDGRLTLDEYSQRADRALTSVTRDDLAVLTHDLAAPSRPGFRPAAVRFGGSRPSYDRLLAVFGTETRRGSWLVPAQLDARALFGECRIEIQEATLHSRVTVIDVQAVFGSVVIVVPDGVEVRTTGMSIFGSRTCDVERDTPPGAPVVEVRGRAVFGEITVRHPGWKEGVRSVIDQHLGRKRP